MYKPKTLLALCAALLLTACGGSGDVVGGGAQGPGTVVPGATSLNTYYPMNFYMQGGDEYEVTDGYFKGLGFNPLIQGHLLAPVNATSLAPVVNSSINDYEITIAGQPLDAREHLPQYQKVLDLPVQLRTAIVIDASSSNVADKAALIAEVKQFIAKAKASSNSVIKNQKFTIWLYATKITPLVGDFETDQSALDAALDSISWDGGYSATYEAIVAAVGQYVGDGDIGFAATGGAAKAFDFRGDGNNDLIDGYDSTSTQLVQLNLSSIVLISAGANNSGGFSAEAAKVALTWQSFVAFNRDLEPAAEGDESLFPGTTLLGKPLIVVNIGSSLDAKLAELATLTINTNSTTTFNFSDSLISAQITAVDDRARIDNLYMLRFPIPYRNGIFDTVVKSNTGVRDMTLTTEMDLTDVSFRLIAQISPTLEIAGPNKAYLPGLVRVSKVTRLYPNILWDQAGTASTTFNWTVGGVARTPDSDGSISISSDDIGATVTLNNSGGLSAQPITIVN